MEALLEVGLGYIALDRSSPTLSRGEAQRVRLAVALTSRLEDMLYVLDEPTIGQHPVDVQHLLPVFRRLAGPVIYVEHDRLAASAADQAIDLGPGAGVQGGHLLYSGSPAGLWVANTPTGRFFSGRAAHALPAPRPEPDSFLTLCGVHLRNLKVIDVPIALERLNVISGVSGSGKSTLVEDVLVASLKAGIRKAVVPSRAPCLKRFWLIRTPSGAIRAPTRLLIPGCPISCAIFLHRKARFRLRIFPSIALKAPARFAAAWGGGGQYALSASSWVLCAACEGERFSDEVLEVRLPFMDGCTPLPISTVFRSVKCLLYCALKNACRLPGWMPRCGCWRRWRRLGWVISPSDSPHPPFPAAKRSV